MRPIAKDGNSRSEFKLEQSPFVGAAPALQPVQRSAGVFADLVNVDVFQDHLESRKPLAYCGAGLGGDLTGAISETMWTDSGDYVVTYRPATGTINAALIGGTTAMETGSGAVSPDCQLVRSDKSAVLFTAAGNKVITVENGLLFSRDLGLASYAKLGSMNNYQATTYKLYRYGIEVCRKTGGVITESSSIRRYGYNAKFTTSGGAYFQLQNRTLALYDTVRLWRSMQLNVTTDSLNNVAVGSPDELYLLASIPVSSLPLTVGAYITVSGVKITKAPESEWWQFEESTTDDGLDDTTVQTIESINLSPFPACGSGCHAAGRFWGVVDGGVAYSLPGGTIYRELFDPLNMLNTPGEQPTAVLEFYGDVLVFTKGSTWRITAGDPANGIYKVAGFGVSGPAYLGEVEGVGVFAVNQDSRCRVLTTSLNWVEEVGGIPFSDHIGDLFVSGCRVASCSGDVFVTASGGDIWKLNLSAGRGWSRYAIAGTSFAGAVVYADGASVAFLRASDRRPFKRVNSSLQVDTTDEGATSIFSCSVAASLDAGRGFVELRETLARMHSRIADDGSVQLSVSVQGQAWTPTEIPYAVIPDGEMSELRILAPRATAYKARPVGRWMLVTLTYTGGVDLYGFILRGVTQASVKPSWNPLAIFGGS